MKKENRFDSTVEKKEIQLMIREMKENTEKAEGGREERERRKRGTEQMMSMMILTSKGRKERETF